MARRSQTFDKILVVLLLCGLAWPVWDMVNKHGVEPGLIFPVGLAIVSVLVVFVLGQGLEELVAVLFWLVAVALFAGSIFDLETGFPGKNAKFDVKYSEQPVLFFIAMLVNLAAVVLGAIFAVAWWRKRGD